jgi:hypothetical protein
MLPICPRGVATVGRANARAAALCLQLHAATAVDEEKVKQQAVVKEAKERAARLRAERQAVQERQALWDESEKRDARRRQAEQRAREQDILPGTGSASSEHSDAQAGPIDEQELRSDPTGCGEQIACETPEVAGTPTDIEGLAHAQCSQGQTDASLLREQCLREQAAAAEDIAASIKAEALREQEQLAQEKNNAALTTQAHAEIQAAVTIQRLARGRAARQALSLLTAMRGSAAAVIQRAFHRRQACVEEAKERAAKAAREAAAIEEEIQRAAAVSAAVEAEIAEAAAAAAAAAQEEQERMAVAAEAATKAAARRRRIAAEAAAQAVVSAAIQEAIDAEALRRRLQRKAAAAARLAASIVAGAVGAAADAAEAAEAQAHAETQAAVTIQRLARGRAARQALSLLTAMRGSAAAVIQRAFHRRQACVDEAKERAAKAAREAAAIEEEIQRAAAVEAEIVERDAAATAAATAAAAAAQEEQERMAAAAEAAALKQQQATAAAAIAAAKAAAAAALQKEQQLAAAVAAETLASKERQRLAANIAVEEAAAREELAAAAVVEAAGKLKEKETAANAAVKGKIATGKLQGDSSENGPTVANTPVCPSEKDFESVSDPVVAPHRPTPPATLFAKPTPPVRRIVQHTEHCIGVISNHLMFQWCQIPVSQANSPSETSHPALRRGCTAGRAHSQKRTAEGEADSATTGISQPPLPPPAACRAAIDIKLGLDDWKCGVGLDLVLESPPAPLRSPRPVDDRRDTNSEAVRLLMAGVSKQPTTGTPKTMGLEAAVQEAASKPTPRPQPRPLPPPKTVDSKAKATPRAAPVSTASGASIPLPGPRWEKMPAEVVSSATALRPAKLGFKKRGVKLRKAAGKLHPKSGPRPVAPPQSEAPPAPDTPTAILEAGLQDRKGGHSSDDATAAPPVNWQRPEKEGELDFVRQVLQQTKSNPALVLGTCSARAAAGSQAQRYARDFARTFKGKVQSARPAARLQAQHTVVQQRHLMQHQRMAVVA